MLRGQPSKKIDSQRSRVTETSTTPVTWRTKRRYICSWHSRATQMSTAPRDLADQEGTYVLGAPGLPRPYYPSVSCQLTLRGYGHTVRLLVLGS